MSVIVLPTGRLSLKSPMGPEVLVRHVPYDNLDGLVHAGRIKYWIATGEILQWGAEIYLETLSSRENLGRTRQNDRVGKARETGQSRPGGCLNSKERCEHGSTGIPLDSRVLVWEIIEGRAFLHFPD